MSRACPTISSTIAGIPELSQEDMIFEDGDIKGICDKIIYLISNGNNLIEAAKYNFNEVKNYNYSILKNRREDFFNKYLKLVEEQI